MNRPANFLVGTAMRRRNDPKMAPKASLTPKDLMAELSRAVAHRSRPAAVLCRERELGVTPRSKA